MTLFTADWNPLGQDIFYRKFELYSMVWNDDINLSDYIVATASFAGPIALIRDDKKLLMKGVSLPPGKPQILVFTPTGKFLSSIKWKNGEIALIGWSNSEDLLIVQDDGTVYVYDIFGTLQNSFILDQEIRDTKIVECKLFNSSTGTGIAVLTGSYRFFVLNNIKEPKIRRLAEVPGLTSTPSSWAIIAKHKQTQLIVAKGDQVYLLDSSEKTCIPVLLQFSGQYNSIAEISVSFYSENIALFTDTGLLWLGETQNELRNKFCEFETQCKTCPQQLLWCGKDAVVSLWKNVLLAVGHDKDWLNYVVDEPVFCVEEVDGIRIIGNEVQEILQRVPQVVVDVFRIGSVSAGALLLEASKEFSRRSHKADEYLRMIRERKQIEYAVNQCIEAAGHEYTVSSQKMLLRAASFGKSFVPETNPECFVKMCETLRVLNAVRNYSIGIPLTYNQLMTLTMGVLLDRLILRRHYCLGLRIASYLKIPEDEGTSRILANWACYKVKQTHIDDEKVARDISNKLGYAPGVSYAEVANKAIEQGRVQLAIRLLDHELRASEQVPLLLRLKQHNQALQKAIDSGDTNLIYTVIYRLRDVLSSGEFLMAIRNFPVAYSLYRKLCKEEHTDLLKDMFYQEDDFFSEAYCWILQSYKSDSLLQQQSCLQSALDSFRKSKNKFCISQTEDQVKLLKYQVRLTEKFPSNYVGLSLQQTLQNLLQSKEFKLAEDLKKEFKIPDKRFLWASKSLK